MDQWETRKGTKLVGRRFPQEPQQQQHNKTECSTGIWSLGWMKQVKRCCMPPTASYPGDGGNSRLRMLCAMSTWQLQWSYSRMISLVVMMQQRLSAAVPGATWKRLTDEINSHSISSLACIDMHTHKHTHIHTDRLLMTHLFGYSPYACAQHHKRHSWIGQWISGGSPNTPVQTVSHPHAWTRGQGVSTPSPGSTEVVWGGEADAPHVRDVCSGSPETAIWQHAIFTDFELSTNMHHWIKGLEHGIHGERLWELGLLRGRRKGNEVMTYSL